MALELGLVLAPIRIRDNVQLASHDYAIKLKGAEVARGELAARLPAGDEPGRRRPGARRHRRRSSRPSACRRSGSRAAHASAPRRRLHRRRPGLGDHHPPHRDDPRSTPPSCSRRQDTQLPARRAQGAHPARSTSSCPTCCSRRRGAARAAELLAEGVSIRDLVTILETLGDRARLTKDPALLAEYCRQALARQITRPLVGPNGALTAITLDPPLEDEVGESIVQTPRRLLPRASTRAAPRRSSRPSRDEVERRRRRRAAPRVLCSARTCAATCAP